MPPSMQGPFSYDPTEHARQQNQLIAERAARQVGWAASPMNRPMSTAPYDPTQPYYNDPAGPFGDFQTGINPATGLPPTVADYFTYIREHGTPPPWWGYNTGGVGEAMAPDPGFYGTAYASNLAPYSYPVLNPDGSVRLPAVGGQNMPAVPPGVEPWQVFGQPNTQLDKYGRLLPGQAWNTMAANRYGGGGGRSKGKTGSLPVQPGGGFGPQLQTVPPPSQFPGGEPTMTSGGIPLGADGTTPNPNRWVANAARLLGPALAGNPFITPEGLARLRRGYAPLENEIMPAFYRYTSPVIQNALMGLRQSVGYRPEEQQFTASQFQPRSLY